ncbi:hypothetical protein [Micromonospora sp. WMMA1976]|uniref:hypothetical protein n=1 Tax=Micromonospora TaxID=1873 RepID=UPI00248C74BD|nr:hypothetical protein [Micromonospora sp. WMMA1976]WBC05343.1 hypothetical protein O7546_10405 [Micromonospora sp. WMMA1976]
MTSEAVGVVARWWDSWSWSGSTGLNAATVWWVGTGLEQWSVSYGDQPGEVADLKRRASLALLVAALMTAVGPAVVALVAYRLRLVRTGALFLVLAVVIAVPAVPFAVLVGRDLVPPPAKTPGPPGKWMAASQRTTS